MLRHVSVLSLLSLCVFVSVSACMYVFGCCCVVVVVFAYVLMQLCGINGLLSYYILLFDGVNGGCICRVDHV